MIILIKNKNLMIVLDEYIEKFNNLKYPDYHWKIYLSDLIISDNKIPDNLCSEFMITSRVIDNEEHFIYLARTSLFGLKDTTYFSSIAIFHRIYEAKVKAYNSIKTSIDSIWYENFYEVIGIKDKSKDKILNNVVRPLMYPDD